MMIFGIPIETIYLYVLVIAGILTLLYILFGDIAEGVLDSTGFLSPILILAFLTFFSTSGYVLEKITSISSIWIIIISAVAALILDIFLNIFVLIPMASAEESLSYTEDSLKGRVGRIIIPIPADGFGEIVIESKSGMISKPAASFDNEEIEEGKKVLVIEVNNGNLYVVPYEQALDANQFN
ncbi:NfeD family protein [Oceanobacillus bengalensis]|nr:NfeD family protein [Oceanobacillus bengalensis]